MEYEFGYKYVIPTGLFYFDCNACGHIAKTPKSTGISLWIGNKTKKCWCFKWHQIPILKKPCRVTGINTKQLTWKKTVKVSKAWKPTFFLTV
jgi:hypothetical protein